MPRPPIVPDRDQSIRSAIRKHTSPDPVLAAEMARSTPGARGALARLDGKRLARGQKAYTQPQSAVGLRAASTGESVVGEPNQSIAGDFVRNLGELAGAIPRLPSAVGKEILALPSAGRKISPAIDKADNPVEAIGNLADVEGLRLLPGSFIASQFGTDRKGVKGLTDDPLFTALDALPFVSKATRGLPQVKAAQRAVDAAGTGERVGVFSTAARYKSTPRTTPVSQRVTTSRGATVRNALEPTLIGRGMEEAGVRMRATRPGSFFAQMFGKNAMDVTQAATRHEASANIANRGQSADMAALLDTRLKSGEMTARGAELGMDATRVAEIYHDMTRGTLDYKELPAHEKQYVDFYRDEVAKLESIRKSSPYSEERLVEVEFTTPSGKTITDLITEPKARPYLAAQRAHRNASTLADIYSRADDPAIRSGTALPTITPDDATRLLTELADLPLNAKKRAAAAQSLISTAEASGLVVTGPNLSYTPRGFVKLPRNAADLAAELRTWRFAPAVMGAPVAPRAIRANLMSLGRGDVAAREIAALIDAKDFQAAANLAKKRADSPARATQLIGGKSWTETHLDLLRAARAQRNVEKFATATNPTKTLSDAQKTLASRTRAAMPDRWRDIIADRTADRLLSHELPTLQASGALTAEEAARAAATISDGLADVADLSPAVQKVMDQVKRDVQSTWLQLVDDGLTPEFVHRVPASRAGQQVNITNMKPRVSSVKETVYDWGSSVNDVMVSLDHAAMEMLSRRAHDGFMSQMADTFGRDYTTLLDQYRDWAHIAYAKNPGKTLKNHIEDLISRDWHKVDIPETVVNGELIPPRSTYMPRDVAQTINKLGPTELGAVGKMFDPVMNVFRTALLPLSPRWHVYNATGGMIMTTAEEGFGALRYTREAWDMARGKPGARDLAHLDVPPMAGGLAGRKLREGAQWGRKSDLTTKSGRAIAAWETGSGQFLRRIWEQAGDGAKNVIDRSYAMNEMVDDMFRSMAFLSGEGKALRGGMTREAAEQAGVVASRRILQSWDRLTPIERSVVRNVFPFYSWAKHLMGFVSRFPFDHPIRTSITASLAQAELEDYGTGLPQMFFTLLDVTGPAGRFGIKPGPDDANSRIMLNVEGINPFRDIGSYATMLGFVASPVTGDDVNIGNVAAITSQMNPVMQTFLRSMGIDPAEGAPDLYQGVSYDPMTGGLRTNVGGNILSDTFQSILPQSRALFDLAGANRDYQQLVQSNPDAAVRRMWTTFGVPATFVPRQFDVEEETIKTEIRRLEDMQRTRATALREGNIGKLGRYDGLHPLRDKLSAAKRDNPDLFAKTQPARESDLIGILTRAANNQPVAPTRPGVRRSVFGG